MIPVNAFLTKFREMQGLLLPVEIAPRGAILLDESLSIHCLEQTELGEDPHGGENQRLTHVRPWMVMAFQNQVLDPSLRQIRS